MSKRNFRIVVFSLLGAGLVFLVLGAVADNGQTRKILLSLTGTFYLAAAIQIVIYRTKPKLFDEKRSGFRETGGGGAGEREK
jgi:hypothetical protein